MPDFSGLDFLRHVRAQGNLVNFGFVTSEGTADMREMVAANGAKFLITKPFDENMFRDMLSPYLAA